MPGCQHEVRDLSLEVGVVVGGDRLRPRASLDDGRVPQQSGLQLGRGETAPSVVTAATMRSKGSSILVTTCLATGMARTRARMDEPPPRVVFGEHAAVVGEPERGHAVDGEGVVAEGVEDARVEGAAVDLVPELELQLLSAAGDPEAGMGAPARLGLDVFAERVVGGEDGAAEARVQVLRGGVAGRRPEARGNGIAAGARRGRARARGSSRAIDRCERAFSIRMGKISGMIS